jgi:2,3-bisphosphoglycerate-dependent phosphoglycerate mutase
MGKLVLIRHGESLWNGRNLFTGWVDVPLTQSGIVEASRASHLINDISFDVVYTSALIRSLQTAFIVLLADPKHRAPYLVHTSDFFHCRWYNRFCAAEHKNMIPVYRCWQLNERYYGDLQGLSKAKIADVFSVDKVVSWRKGYTERPPKGESLKDTSKRVLPFFNKVIMKQLEEGKNILISAHSNTLRSIVMKLEQMDEAQVVGLEVDTASVVIYNYDDNGFVREELPQKNIL